MMALFFLLFAPLSLSTLAVLGKMISSCRNYRVRRKSTHTDHAKRPKSFVDTHPSHRPSSTHAEEENSSRLLAHLIPPNLSPSVPPSAPPDTPSRDPGATQQPAA